LTLAKPYLDQFANVLIQGGALHLDVQLASGPEDPLAVRGALEITGLDTLDGQRKLPLLAWQSARIDAFKYSAATNLLGIAGIALQQPYIRVRANEDRSTNLRRLLVEPEQRADAGTTAGGAAEPGAAGAAAAAEPAGKPFVFRLGPVTVVDGIADFSDLSLPIPFSTRVTQLTGGTSPLDIDSREPMTIKLEGRVADYGLARVDGAFLPVAPWQKSTLALTFRNVALPDLSPYTVRFAGHQLAGGRMDLDLRYTVEQGRLKGDNNVILRDLELGPKVPYEGAMDLPLGLAIALLKGPDGRIDVDLPVEGNVNDPEFRIGGVIWKAIGSLVTRVVTAPFRLLGALVGMESADFEQVVFAPCEAVVTPPEREKLAGLAEAMAQRPQLALRVPGVIAEAEDTAALRETRVDSAIGERLAAVAQPQDSPEISWRRRRDVLEELFAARYPEQSLDAILESHMIPVDPAEPEGRHRLDDVAYLAHLRGDLVAAETVPAEALQQLAGQRAAAVAAELTAAGVEAERVLVEGAQVGKVGKNGWIGLKLEVDQR
ncbi:MAG: DUF748 domain-containing protein, partial [Methylococcaceae bacterium]|nr:DUF748 domain-containing protein [Methylococcaceae bacterium]